MNNINVGNNFDLDNILTETDIFFESYIDWIKENLLPTNNHIDKKLYNQYFVTYIINRTNYQLIKEQLNQDIDTSYNMLFNVSLLSYLRENDEPVWVDRDDSLQVIKWAVETANDKYNSSNYLKYSNVYFDSLNISYVDSNLYLLEKKFIVQEFSAASAYELDNHYLNYHLYNYYNNKLTNNDTFIYLNKYYSNAFIQHLNEYINKTFINQKDINNEVLFYLNLYKRIYQTYYQEMYFKGETTLKDIKAQINNNLIFNNSDKDILLINVNMNYYMLYEYRLYLSLKNIFLDSLNLYSHKTLMKLLNNNLYPN